MPENEPTTPRLKGRVDALEKELKELREATQALLQGMKAAESATDETLMPEGKDLGVSFE